MELHRKIKHNENLYCAQDLVSHTTKYMSTNFQGIFHLSFKQCKIKNERAKSVDPDAAHYELPHLDLHCLQIQFHFWRLKG